ncbi:MAG TPA: class II fructose-bisphosphate aldolase [Gemmatimonadaceae bacterium]|nr:class II fructose-bisphosphate aldolase [Gemmatimonadaceae bacterium]
MTNIQHPFGAAVEVQGARVRVADQSVLASPKMDELVRTAVFGAPDARESARWLLWEIGQAVGVRPASIHDLYMARGRGECGGFTVPAMNIRGRAYDTMRAVFRVAMKRDAGAFIFEIARSEIAYTDQRPAEYAAVAIGAALREGFRGPVFIQGDHFQVNAKKYAADAKAEVDAVRLLAREGLAAGFYNIDLDTSTLVDLSHATLEEQQRLNFEVGVELAAFVRSLEPEGITVSLGGEIGEVGTANSTVPELRAFMDGFNRRLEEVSRGAIGLSKISVQSGTSHGGVVLPDGSIADVQLDFQTLTDLSRVARDEYGLAGAVQHGASTLPDGAFNHFPRTETCEIHLATNFQNMLYEHVPSELRDRIYAWLATNAKDERKIKDTEEQFVYKTRKKALGPFKRELWDLPEAQAKALDAAYEVKFDFLFAQLGIVGTAPVVAKFVSATPQHRPPPGGVPAAQTAPDDPDAGE